VTEANARFGGRHFSEESPLFSRLDPLAGAVGSAWYDDVLHPIGNAGEVAFGASIQCPEMKEVVARLTILCQMPIVRLVIVFADTIEICMPG